MMINSLKDEKQQTEQPIWFFWLGLLLIVLALWALPIGKGCGEQKVYTNDTVGVDSPKFYYQSLK